MKSVIHTIKVHIEELEVKLRRCDAGLDAISKDARCVINKHLADHQEALRKINTTEENSNSSALSEIAAAIDSYDNGTLTHAALLNTIACALPCGDNNTSSPKLPEFDEIHAEVGDYFPETFSSVHYDVAKVVYNFIAGKIGR